MQLQLLSSSVNGALVVLGAGFGTVGKFGGAFGRKWLLLLALTCLPGLAFAVTPPPANYYVATTGSDTANNGTTPTTPFANITHALLQCHGGETIAVASGTYSTLTWTGTQSGYLRGAVVYLDSTHLFTSMVTVVGWGATQPLIQPPSGAGNRAIYCNGACFMTFNNFEMRSQVNDSLVIIDWNSGAHAPDSHDITIENCDLSDPDTADPSQTAEPPAIWLNHSNNITIQGCYIHDSEAGIAAPDGTGAPSNNINILNNTFNNFTCDGIFFSDWNNVTISGNTIENVYDTATSTIHNDGLQISGPDQNVTITNNVIAHSHGQLLFMQPFEGSIDNVLVENNVIWDADGFSVQSMATHATYINNTILGGALGDLLLRSYNTIVPTDTVVANNSLGNLGYYQGAAAAYEDYNNLPIGQGAGAHDIRGANPNYMNTADGDFHPASGSPLFAHGAHSWSATVDGTLTNFTAPATDLDHLTQTNPPAIGAYATSDTSFEAPSVGAKSYRYDPTGSSWTFASNSGIQSNGSAWGAATAPDGVQTAFLQGISGANGTISRVLSFPTTGIFTVSLKIAKRSYGGVQSTNVKIDGTVVGTFAPTSTSFTTVTTNQFHVSTTGTHTLSFVGTSTTGDCTDFIDAVALNNVSPVVVVPNSGFETPVTSTYVYNPTGGSWTFAGNSGVQTNGSLWRAPLAPDGVQTAFLEGKSGANGTISQAISFPTTGTFNVSFLTAQHPSETQSFNVLIDGAVVGSFAPTSTNFTSFTTNAFTVSTTGTHTLSFVGTSTTGDETVFLDSVQVHIQ